MTGNFEVVVALMCFGFGCVSLGLLPFEGETANKSVRRCKCENQLVDGHAKEGSRCSKVEIISGPYVYVCRLFEKARSTCNSTATRVVQIK